MPSYTEPYANAYPPRARHPRDTRPVCQSSSFFSHYSSTCSPQTCRPKLAALAHRIVAFRQLSPAGLICRDDSRQACQRHARPNVNTRARSAQTQERRTPSPRPPSAEALSAHRAESRRARRRQRPQRGDRESHGLPQHATARTRINELQVDALMRGQTRDLPAPPQSPLEPSA